MMFLSIADSIFLLFIVLFFVAFYLIKYIKNGLMLNPKEFKNKVTEQKNDLGSYEILKIMGVNNHYVLSNILAIKYTIIMVISSLIYLYAGFTAVLVVLPFCVFIPDVILNYLSSRFIKYSVKNFHYILEMISIGMKNGMTFERSLNYTTESVAYFDPKLYKLCNDMNLLIYTKGIDIGLSEFENKYRDPIISNFCMFIIQSYSSGASVSLILDDLASDIKERNLLKVEESIGKLAAKMSIPLIIFILMPLVILIVAPGFIRIFSSPLLGI
ncbi:type II secretion system F family protein [Vibrio paucivorans]